MVAPTTNLNLVHSTISIVTIGSSQLQKVQMYSMCRIGTLTGIANVHQIVVVNV
jgi:hypothetical protein